MLTQLRARLRGEVLFPNDHLADRLKDMFSGYLSGFGHNYKPPENSGNKLILKQCAHDFSLFYFERVGNVGYGKVFFEVTDTPHDLNTAVFL